MQIAIDGPASAGKSTIAKLIAKELNFIYSDTGAMYRAVTLMAKLNNVKYNDEENILLLMDKFKISFKNSVEGQRVFINDQDVSEEIRTVEITNNVSEVSALPIVRERLVEEQRRIAQEGDVVMDGRDIGTTVLPNAEVKIFMIASVHERAVRRFKEYESKGIDVSLETLEKEIEDRDYKDSHRKISPLKKAKDAIELDTTGLSIDQVVQKVIDIIKK
ncbi:cytidylate kinase [Companilactobacillus sp. RD055328]|uniref:(d)CMP kinase n=1 Tax=Companilactobacillus sp. RD055328 TaxID=2916634 RepID=UPI001FC83D96|nr:(d)CMP kinase [Companilactobacillus sp. RD055328]GKQ42736.1 cytidylate kinase [Companilactobacillus sp. RD055328]